MTTAPSSSTPAAGLPDWLALVREKVEGLSYGVVQITVHDRRVTQIERTEKTCLDGASTPLPRHPACEIFPADRRTTGGVLPT